MNEQDDRQEHQRRPEQIRVDVHIHSDSDAKVMAKLTEILTAVKHMEKTMANEMADLEAKVASNGDVIDSAIVLIQGIKTALDAAIAAGNDPAALKALSDSLGTQDDKLAAAVAENTPAAP